MVIPTMLYGDLAEKGIIKVDSATVGGKHESLLKTRAGIGLP